MTSFEDNDIKIFNPEKNKKADAEMLEMVEALDHHRRNGNAGRARKLGKDLAKLALNDELKDSLTDEGFLSSDVITEVGVLLLFSTEAALNYFLPTTQLSAIAIASLHDKLGQAESEFYKNVIESPAYSFYYLSIRKGGADVASDIGEAFAMLCRHEGDQKFIEEGKHIYNMVIREVEKDIKKANFQD